MKVAGYCSLSLERLGMADTRILILEGASGHAFFLKEILLAEGLANQVDLVSSVAQAIELLQPSDAYDLVIINLVETWEKGLQLGFWLCEQSHLYPTLLIVPQDIDHPRLVKPTPISILTAPISLKEFVNAARAALKPTTSNLPMRQTQSCEVPIFLFNLYKNLAC